VNKPIYKRIVDKSEIPTCNILGVNLGAINMEWLLNYLDKNIKALSGDYICVSNVHTTVMSYEDREYCKIQNEGILAIPDGGPLSKIGRKRGFRDMKRTTGPDLMEEIFSISPIKGYKHYFYGSTSETLEKMRINLEKKYPGISIVGMHSPPFQPLDSDEDREIVQLIKDVQPDFIWVGLGAPKQEIWMSEHQGKICGLMVGVGAGFDYFANNIKRAPLWMQKSNLEWLYRLLQDPKRLFKRYLKVNTKFLWLISKRNI
jgi:N-acetylglucosaminyldiphosphoundecaprenol N-acetyl-beta-D-mannosaminyltransferase